MINTVEEFSKKEASRPGLKVDKRLKRTLAQIGRSMFSHRLEIGLGVTAIAEPLPRSPLRCASKRSGFAWF